MEREVDRKLELKHVIQNHVQLLNENVRLMNSSVPTWSVFQVHGSVMRKKIAWTVRTRNIAVAMTTYGVVRAAQRSTRIGDVTE